MTETEVIKKGKPAIFWIIFTSVFWIIFVLLCNSLIFLLIGKDPEVQKVILQKFNNQAGIETETPKSDNEVVLEENLEKTETALNTCTIELEVLQRVIEISDKKVEDKKIVLEPTIVPTDILELENLESE